MTSGRTLSRRGAHLSTEALENIFAVCFPRQDAGLCLPQGVIKRSWRPFAVSLQLLSTVRQSAFVALLKELGCDTTRKTKDGETGEQLAKRKGNRKVLEQLRTAQ